MIYSYESQCHKKYGYDSKAKARKVMRRMGNTQLGRLNVYICPHCGKYHVGKLPNRNGEKRYS